MQRRFRLMCPTSTGSSLRPEASTWQAARHIAHCAFLPKVFDGFSENIDGYMNNETKRVIESGKDHSQQWICLTIKFN